MQKGPAAEAGDFGGDMEGEAEDGRHSFGNELPSSPGGLETGPELSSSSSSPRSLSFASARDISFRSSVASSTSSSSSSSLILDWEFDDDDGYRVFQSEYEEIPSLRWLASPLRLRSSLHSDGRTGFSPPSAVPLDWKRLLPSDYKMILSRAVSPVQFSSQRQLYHRLCEPLLIDNGQKRFFFEKSTGKKCYDLLAGGLEVSGISRTTDPGEVVLSGIRWLEIRGQINKADLSPGTNYAASLVFALGDDSYGLSGYQEASISDGVRTSLRTVCLKPTEYLARQGIGIRERLARTPVRRGDGEWAMEMGEFYVEGGCGGGIVHMVLKETGRWKLKGGLTIRGIEVRPGN